MLFGIDRDPKVTLKGVKVSEIDPDELAKIARESLEAARELFLDGPLPPELYELGKKLGYW